MTDQFSYPHARSDDPDTSHEAAATINISAQAKRMVCA